MTIKEELSKIKAIKLEIKDLRNRIDHLPITKDLVHGSMTEHPYTTVGIPITGIDENATSNLRRKLERKCEELQDEIAELENFLNDIDDPEVRLILRLFYVDGLSQSQIGAELGYDRSSVSKKMKKFWKNAEQ